VDILAFPVLRDLEQIDQTQETRLTRQLRSDIRKTNRRDRIHFDLTFFHTVPGANLDVRTRPYPDTASDFSAANSLAQMLAEHHEESLYQMRRVYTRRRVYRLRFPLPEARFERQSERR